MTAITLELPDQTITQARLAAVALQKPVEQVLTDMITAVLPSLQNAPTDLQAELIRMTWLETNQ